MYIPPQFEEVRETEILKIIENFPLAVLVCNNDGDLIANHIPLFRHSPSAYLGHIAKANQLHNIFPNGADALAIFSSENSYVSPNWYPTKAETHRHVPTWNYQVVHLSGKIFFSDNKKDKIEVIGSLTNYHEKNLAKNKPWKISDVPKEYITMRLKNIVAFEIKVDKCLSNSKLNKIKSKEGFKSVLLKMKENGKNELYNKMKKINKNNN